jgi:DNA-3-methyladenine glycosylase II
MRRDPVLGALIKRIGRCRLADVQREDPFHALVETIVGQQLSMRAAAAIFGRFLALFPPGRFPSPAAISGVTDTELRSTGFSRQKIGYLRDVCRRLEAGTLALDRLDRMADEEVIETLTEVKGIGRWSAEMILMFKLHRPDVLPVDDLGIVKAVERAYGMKARPKPARITAIGENWRPYRSVACWYLWASLDNAPA